jgi:flagellar motor switch/type III secretory pathway protein FliN
MVPCARFVSREPAIAVMSANNLSKKLAAAGPRPLITDDHELAQRLAGLPPYSRSLLRISVPVVVTLASSPQPLNRVVDLAPGTILHFSKPCDEPLTLSVGRCEVAVGETVKIGDKFGLRVTSMVMPKEKFEAVQPFANP